MYLCPGKAHPPASFGNLQMAFWISKAPETITIRLVRNELSGPHESMLTKTQINKLTKAMSQGTGSRIKISKTQIRKAIKHGDSLWGSLISLGSKLLPMGMPLAKKAIAPLATGALSG